jgi:hypothetical protein
MQNLPRPNDSLTPAPAGRGKPFIPSAVSASPSPRGVGAAFYLPSLPENPHREGRTLADLIPATGGRIWLGVRSPSSFSVGFVSGKRSHGGNFDVPAPMRRRARRYRIAYDVIALVTLPIWMFILSRIFQGLAR